MSTTRYWKWLGLQYEKFISELKARFKQNMHDLEGKEYAVRELQALFGLVKVSSYMASDGCIYAEALVSHLFLT